MSQTTTGTRKRKAAPPKVRNGRTVRNAGERVSESPPEPQYVPDAHCPDCGCRPPVRFTAAEVQRARRDRQSTRVQNVQCSKCRTRYWIRSGDIARAKLDGRNTGE